MTPDTTAMAPVSDHTEVMSSIDKNGLTQRFVIADISQDDAWISVPVSANLELDAWE